MAKKKNSRQKHQKNLGDPKISSDESNCTNNKGCSHVSRAVNLAKIRKYLRANPNVKNCASCMKIPPGETQDSDKADSEVWLCLQCGNCGCGRNSLQHAIIHHRTPSSDSHAIVLGTASMCIWCYECDEKVQNSTSGVINDCIDLVKKTCSAKRPSVHKNGILSKTVRNNSVNDPMANQLIESEPVSTTLSSKNISEESVEVQSPKKSRKTKEKKPIHKPQKIFDDANTSTNDGSSTYNEGCPHTSNAINLVKMREYIRAIPNIKICESCVNLAPKETPYCDTEDSEEVWLCLQCGHCGCGRNSLQHAVMHHRTPSSDSHAIALSTTSMCIWCYECDDEIQNKSSCIIRESIDLVKKTSSDKSPGVSKNGIVSQRVLNNSVNDCTTKCSLIESEPVSTTLGRRNIPDEPVEVQPSKNRRKPDQNMPKACIKGLRNLGNTCFFNAVMQNLSQTPWLCNELERRAENSNCEIPFPFVLNIFDEENETLEDSYPLSQSLLNLLKQMNSSTPTRSGGRRVINPEDLFEQICRESPQFLGFEQQDSHELLRHLLDGVRNEEIRRLNRGIQKALYLEKIGGNSVDEEIYGVDASHTLVEKIFGGQLLSIILCEECQMSSQVFEEFMDLSLPLPLSDQKPLSVNKCHKLEASEDYGIHQITGVEEAHTMLSKRQERTMKRQAKRTAKKEAKSSKQNSSQSLNEELLGGSFEKSTNLTYIETGFEGNKNGIAADDRKVKGNLENSRKSKTVHEEQNAKSNNEFSKVDIEDNESACCKSPTVAPEKPIRVNGNFSSEDICEDGMKCVQEMHYRLQDLSSKITDIEIRRDINRQNLLDGVNGQACCGRNQENGAYDSTSEPNRSHPEFERWVHPDADQFKREWLLKSLTTVKPRYQASTHECSVNSCLNEFTAPELLTGSNRFRCENCTSLKREATGNKSETIYSNAKKHLLIFSPPAVLTLHLKRFQHTGMSLRKLNLFVQFPRVLDLAPYCSSVCLKLPHMAGVKDDILYSLYGIVQHSGSLTSGHYTAYVRASKSQLNSAFLNNWPMRQCNLDQLLEKIRRVKTQVNETVYNMSNEKKHVWYYVSDGDFKEVSEMEVFKCQAYILFYERIK